MRVRSGGPASVLCCVVCVHARAVSWSGCPRPFSSPPSNWCAQGVMVARRAFAATHINSARPRAMKHAALLPRFQYFLQSTLTSIAISCAHGVEVSHPLRVWKALGSTPSVSNISKGSKMSRGRWTKSRARKRARTRRDKTHAHNREGGRVYLHNARDNEIKRFPAIFSFIEFVAPTEPTVFQGMRENSKH